MVMIVVHGHRDHQMHALKAEMRKIWAQKPGSDALPDTYNKGYQTHGC